MAKEIGAGPDQNIAGMALISLARLNHEQGQIEVAISEYEKASVRWASARIVDELRMLMVGWIDDEIEGCRRGMPTGPVPAIRAVGYRTDRQLLHSCRQNCSTP